MHRHLDFTAEGKGEGEGEDEDSFAFEDRPYLRREGDARLGPSRFGWTSRQLADLTALFHGEETDGARQRIGRDLARFMSALSWRPDEDALQRADDIGEEVVFTVRSSAPELYTLPWEIVRTDASDTFLADHPSVMVRHAVPDIPVRALPAVPERPGVLLAWSDAGGRVPSAAMKASIEAACEAGGVAFQELPRVHAGTLQDALDDAPLSVVHLLCHGQPARRPGEPARLAWGDGSQPPISAVRLAKLLRPYRSQVRMVVLSVCGSGDASQDALYMGSVGQEIHKKGIPTVVCSRYKLSIPGATRLVEVLYDKLLREGWSLERAIRHARMQLFRADALGETQEGDAYGLQIYTHAAERCAAEGVAADRCAAEGGTAEGGTAEGVAAEGGTAEGGAPEQSEAARPVLATYPFGTPQAPAPETPPPQQVMTIVPAATPEARQAQRDMLLEALRMLSEDPQAELLAQLGGPAAGARGEGS